MRPPRGGGSFRGRGGRYNGGRGGGGRFGGGNREGGRFGGGGWRDEGPPSQSQVATFVHACEGETVTKLCQEKTPRFNAPIYLQNKTQIGSVDEIFGPINESLFSIKMMEGIVGASYAEGDKFYIDPLRLLPLARFLPQPKRQSTGVRGRGRGPPRDCGGFSSNRNPPRGRGGFSSNRGAPRGRVGFPRGRGRGGY